MGLMYPFPVSEDETDFVEKKDKSLTLKTYGLPYIFWIYALCSLAVVFFMFMAIKAPIFKLIELGDETDAILGHSLLSFIGALPIFIFGFFFFEKRILVSSQTLGLKYRIFGVTIFSEEFQVKPEDELKVEPFIDSPNMARLKGNPEEMGFQNKGYFVLWLKMNNGKKIFIDRHSRKTDLDKLKNLLENVIKT
jgi:hypothetical protein